MIAGAILVGTEKRATLWHPFVDADFARIKRTPRTLGFARDAANCGQLPIMNADGSNLHQLSPSGGNSQGPAFSPDGKWVVFTAYFDHYGDEHGCEIYIIRINGTDLRRLTNNDYCDYQPRWGP